MLTLDQEWKPTKPSKLGDSISYGVISPFWGSVDEISLSVYSAQRKSAAYYQVFWYNELEHKWFSEAWSFNQTKALNIGMSMATAADEN